MEARNPPLLSLQPCLSFEIGFHVSQASLRLKARTIGKCHHAWFAFIHKQVANPPRCKERGCSREQSDPGNEQVSRTAFSYFWKVQPVTVNLLAKRIHILLPWTVQLILSSTNNPYDISWRFCHLNLIQLQIRQFRNDIADSMSYENLWQSKLAAAHVPYICWEKHKIMASDSVVKKRKWGGT